MKDIRQIYIKNNLVLRAKLINAIRNFFINRGYLEIETPVRIPSPAPESYIDAQPCGDWFLQTSPELCMKRLLAAGYPRIFQLCKCFRQNERGDKHLPEFTMLEWYASSTNYLHMMEECEEMIINVARQTGFYENFQYQGSSLDLTRPWDRLTIEDAFNKYASVSLENALLNDTFDEIMTQEIEPFIGNIKPMFLYDYPAKRAALAKIKPDDCRYAQRFELYMFGLEICNGFSELTDPEEQRGRFENERKNRAEMNKILYPMPEKFLDSLNYIPESSGNALGVDRLIMLFSNQEKIDDVTAFTPEEL